MKKFKKLLLPLLIVVAIIQLAVPAHRIWDKYNILVTGEEVKIRVNPIDPYDAFRGRYVSLRYNFSSLWNRNGKYGILEVDNDGFASIVNTTEEKPSEGLYLISEINGYFSMPFDRYYMEEEMAPKAEKLLSGTEEAYITVRIKDDEAVVSGLFIDGVPIEELLEKKQ